MERKYSRALRKSNNYTVSILNKEDREYVGQFFAKRPNIDISDFLRYAILRAIRETRQQEFQKFLDEVNAHQRLHGGQQV